VASKLKRMDFEEPTLLAAELHAVTSCTL